MANSAYKAKLAKLKKDWGKAKSEAGQAPQGGDFKQIPPGRYDAQISDGEINESQNGRLQAYIEVTVLEGENAGETQRKYWGLDKPEHLQYFHRDIMRLGYEVPDDPEELETLLKEIVKDKPKLRIRIKENGEYMNVYFDKLIQSEGAEAPAPAEAPEAPEAPAPAPVKPKAKAAPAPAAEPEPAAEAPAEESGGDISIGMRLHVTSAGQNGTVKAIDETEGTVTVKLDNKTLVEVGPEDLAPEQEAAPEPAPAPKKAGLKVGKK